MKKSKYLLGILQLTVLVLLSACSTKKFVANPPVAYQYNKVEYQSDAESSSTKFLQPYKASSDSLMKIIVGHTSIPLTKSQPESTMGNYVADAQLSFAQSIDSQVVGSVINYGGLRIQYLAPGPITLGNIFEIMPFDNTLVIAEVPGKTLKTLAQLIIDKKGWPIAGLKIIINQEGNLKEVLINNQPINDHIIYKIAISDYLANGGDQCEFFKSCKRKYFKTVVRDIMVSYLQQQGTIHPKLTERIVYE